MGYFNFERGLMKKKPVSTKDLPTAIETLESFSRQKGTSISIYLFRKTMSFARRLFSKSVKEKIEIPPHIISKSIVPRKFHTLGEKTKLAALVEKKAILPQELILSAPAKQELDAFRMKAITLLKQHEIRFTSLTDQLHMIREVPIVMIENTSFSKAFAENIIAMQQTISPFPGETIELQGAFQRNSQSHSRSVPIPHSFHITTKSRQTGYPHPSQHHGWALSHTLIPAGHPLIAKMDDIARQLIPEESLNIKAKELLKIKQHCFNSNVDEFLEMHKQMNQAMLKIAHVKEHQVLDHFFENLKKENNIYKYLSEIHKEIISNIFEKNVAKSAFSLPCDLEYIKLISAVYERLLGKNKYLLKELAVKQLQEFIWELEMPVKSPQEMHQWLQEMLSSDIHVWKGFKGQVGF